VDKASSETSVGGQDEWEDEEEEFGEGCPRQLTIQEFVGKEVVRL
jgi:hypothetical protein